MLSSDPYVAYRVGLAKQMLKDKGLLTDHEQLIDQHPSYAYWLAYGMCELHEEKLLNEDNCKRMLQFIEYIQSIAESISDLREAKIFSQDNFKLLCDCFAFAKKGEQFCFPLAIRRLRESSILTQDHFVFLTKPEIIGNSFDFAITMSELERAQLLTSANIAVLTPENTREICGRMTYLNKGGILTQGRFNLLVQHYKHAKGLADAMDALSRYRLLTQKNETLLVQNVEHALKLETAIRKLKDESVRIPIRLDGWRNMTEEDKEAVALLSHDNNFELLAQAPEYACDLASAMCYLSDLRLLNIANRDLLAKHPMYASNLRSAMEQLEEETRQLRSLRFLTSPNPTSRYGRHEEDKEALALLEARQENFALLTRNPQYSCNLANAMSILRQSYLLNRNTQALLTKHVEHSSSLARAMSTLKKANLLNPSNMAFLDQHPEYFNWELTEVMIISDRVCYLVQNTFDTLITHRGFIKEMLKAMNLLQEVGLLTFNNLRYIIDCGNVFSEELIEAMIVLKKAGILDKSRYDELIKHPKFIKDILDLVRNDPNTSDFAVKIAKMQKGVEDPVAFQNGEMLQLEDKKAVAPATDPTCKSVMGNISEVATQGDFKLSPPPVTITAYQYPGKMGDQPKDVLSYLKKVNLLTPGMQALLEQYGRPTYALATSISTLHTAELLSEENLARLIKLFKYIMDLVQSISHLNGAKILSQDNFTLLCESCVFHRTKGHSDPLPIATRELQKEGILTQEHFTLLTQLKNIKFAHAWVILKKANLLTKENREALTHENIEKLGGAISLFIDSINIGYLTQDIFKILTQHCQQAYHLAMVMLPLKQKKILTPEKEALLAQHTQYDLLERELSALDLERKGGDSVQVAPPAVQAGPAVSPAGHAQPVSPPPQTALQDTSIAQPTGKPATRNVAADTKFSPPPGIIKVLTGGAVIHTADGAQTLAAGHSMRIPRDAVAAPQKISVPLSIPTEWNQICTSRNIQIGRGPGKGSYATEAETEETKKRILNILKELRRNGIKKCCAFGGPGDFLNYFGYRTDEANLFGLWKPNDKGQYQMTVLDEQGKAILITSTQISSCLYKVTFDGEDIDFFHKDVADGKPLELNKIETETFYDFIMANLVEENCGMRFHCREGQQRSAEALLINLLFYSAAFPQCQEQLPSYASGAPHENLIFFVKILKCYRPAIAPTGEQMREAVSLSQKVLEIYLNKLKSKSEALSRGEVALDELQCADVTRRIKANNTTKDKLSAASDLLRQILKSDRTISEATLLLLKPTMIEVIEDALNEAFKEEKACSDLIKPIEVAIRLFELLGEGVSRNSINILLHNKSNERRLTDICCSLRQQQRLNQIKPFITHASELKEFLNSEAKNFNLEKMAGILTKMHIPVGEKDNFESIRKKILQLIDKITDECEHAASSIRALILVSGLTRAVDNQLRIVSDAQREIVSCLLNIMAGFKPRRGDEADLNLNERLEALKPTEPTAQVVQSTNPNVLLPIPTGQRLPQLIPPPKLSL